jgi:hypothetical protein
VVWTSRAGGKAPRRIGPFSKLGVLLSDGRVLDIPFVHVVVHQFRLPAVRKAGAWKTA